jgi:hypothetical protein
VQHVLCHIYFYIYRRIKPEKDTPHIMNRLFTAIGCIALCGLLPTITHAQVNSVMLKASGTNIGFYTSIQNAYNAIPATLTQPYELELQDNYNGANETFPVTFINKGGASAANTITVTNTGNASLSVNCNLSTTDAFVFDNADWVNLNSKDNASGAYPTFRVNGTGTSQSHYMVVLKNGASNNIISNLDLGGRTTGTGSAIYLATGGNTNNTLERNMIQAPIGITSNGTIVNPNTDLTIKSNSIVGYKKAAIFLNQGVGKVHIDSNNIVAVGLAPQTESYGIVHQSLNDSLFITRNVILFSSQNFNAITRGIELSVVGNDVFSLVANNMVLGESGAIQVLGDTMFHTIDSMSNLVGISYTGGGSTRANVINNTVKLTGKMDISTVLNSFSAAFENDIVNSTSEFRVINNIFVNERDASTAGGENILVFYLNPATLLLSDYNTYNSASGNIAKVGTNIYTSISAFRTVIGAVHEVQSNLYPITFIDDYDLHLDRNALGNANLTGMVVGNFSRDDVDGQMRAAYTRGADEYAPICLGVSTSSHIVSQTSSTLCMNDYVDMSVSIDVPTVNGVIYHWQSRPAGSSLPFTSIAGPAGSKKRLVQRPPLGSTEYRFVDSCLRSGSMGISDTVTVTVNPKPDITGINSAHVGLIFDFSPSGNVADINPLTYHWDFGDTRTSGVDSPTHTYTAEGTYDVMLYVVGICGTDTFRTTVNASLAVGNVQTGKLSVYPNPATGRFMLQCTNLPVGEQVNITVTSMLGSNVYKQSFRNTSSKLQRDVDVSGFAPGVYNVELRSGTQVYRGNIVLQ